MRGIDDDCIIILLFLDFKRGCEILDRQRHLLKLKNIWNIWYIYDKLFAATEIKIGDSPGSVLES